MSKTISRSFIAIVAVCVLVNDLLYLFNNPVKLSGVGAEDVLRIVLSISAMIAIPGSFFLLYYAYRMQKKNKILSVVLFVVSGFYIFLLLRSWIETYNN
ncbi:hypothetical protein FNH22_12725 [Fulvivirga sp. M361]|uniref:hypothetical protein n=1 Tax=Fulvivirga sp. M361 TaxID=2594266 RepID=UPI001179F7C6|nr:hypothetical protein [Fulvivirga sp. M361]TRX58735.1 hypothetical protein FNH22_12725 [Fulvivirga sp. M361]